MILGVNPESLISLRDVLNRSQAHVSYLGSREVRVPDLGNVATINLEELAQKVFLISRQRFRTDNLTPQERIVGTEITRKISDLYARTEDILRNSNCVIQLAAFVQQILRDLFSFFDPHALRDISDILREARDNFLSYPNNSSFARDFSTRPRSGGLFDPGAEFRMDRQGWLVREDTVRALIRRSHGRAD